MKRYITKALKKEPLATILRNVVVLCLALAFIPLQHVMAVSYTTSRQYSNNNILFYSEGEDKCVPATIINPSSTVVRTGVDTSREVTASEYSGIKTAGYSFMGRYLEITSSGTGAPFNGMKPQFLTTDELSVAQQAGVDIFLIFEWNMGPPNPTPNDPETYPNSSDHGARDAQIALNALAKLGLPATTPVYYSLDRGYKSNQGDDNYYATLPQVIDYFNGINSVINNTNAIGAYASKEELLALKQQNLIGWLWHAKWKDQVDSVGWGAHMYQQTEVPNVAGVPVDYNFAYANNIGQIGSVASYSTQCGTVPTGIQGIVAIAQQEYEKNKGQLAFSEDPNMVFPGSDYTNGVGGDDAYWCAWFVSWVYKQAGFPFTDGTNGWAIPGVPSVIDYFKNKQTFIDLVANPQEDPQPGDVIFYAFPAGQAGDQGSHVQLVISYDSATKAITYIGGNECSNDAPPGCSYPYSELNMGTITKGQINSASGNMIGLGRYKQ